MEPLAAFDERGVEETFSGAREGTIRVMRLLFVNYAHPAEAHISSVRVPAFAREMARRGHEVILATKPGLGEIADERSLQERLSFHDWHQPFVLTWKMTPSPLLARMLLNHFPAWIQKPMTAWWYVTRGGVRWDWTLPGIPVMRELRTIWKADVVWGSFGCMEVVHLAQQIASLMQCPWCLDIKDNWMLFTPTGLRRWLAWRYRDATAVTLNSKFNMNIAKPFFCREAHVIYSGVDESLYAGLVQPSDFFDIVVIGSVYGLDRFAGFLKGVVMWLERLSAEDRKKVRLIYAGCDATVAEKVLQVLKPLCKVEIHQHLPLAKMVAIARSAAINCYMWLPHTFHHKLVELLWCRRPILAYPGEHDESIEIVKQVAGDLRICRDHSQVGMELEQLWNTPCYEVASSRDALRFFTWDRQADKLEKILLSVFQTGKDKHVTSNG